MSDKIREELDYIIKTIVRKSKPERIILFGSYASGNPKSWSDFDLFVIKDTSKRQIERAREIRRILPRGRSKGVDLIVLNPEEFNQALKERNIYLSKILKEGKELYARI